MSTQQPQQAAITDYVTRFCEFCECTFTTEPETHLEACEHAETETLNHGGFCTLCGRIIKGPMHEHIGDCTARDDVFDGEHPDGDAR